MLLSNEYVCIFLILFSGRSNRRRGIMGWRALWVSRGLVCEAKEARGKCSARGLDRDERAGE